MRCSKCSAISYRKDIYQFAGKMMDDYRLSGYTIHPYGGK